MKKLLIIAALFVAVPASAQQISQQQSQGLAKIALEFLGRTDLKGTEADAMFQVKVMLNAIVGGSLIVTEKPAAEVAPAKEK